MHTNTRVHALTHKHSTDVHRQKDTNKSKKRQTQNTWTHAHTHERTHANTHPRSEHGTRKTNIIMIIKNFYSRAIPGWASSTRLFNTSTYTISIYWHNIPAVTIHITYLINSTDIKHSYLFTHSHNPPAKAHPTEPIRLILLFTVSEYHYCHHCHTFTPIHPFTLQKNSSLLPVQSAGRTPGTEVDSCSPGWSISTALSPKTALQERICRI